MTITSTRRAHETTPATPVAKRGGVAPWQRALRVFTWLYALVVVLAALFPLAWMVVSGFKARTEVVTSPFQFFPDVWRWSNYQEILADPAFVRAMAVTFAGATLFMLLSLGINSMAAYAFARLEFAFKRVLWPVVLGTMFIPAMAIMLTSYIVVTRLGMLNTIWVLVVPGATSAAHIFFIRQFYLGIPTSMEEAALIDGAGRWRIFWSLFVPLSKPVFVVVGITSFLAYWNAYIWPVMTITDSGTGLMQIQQYLASFRSEFRVEYGMLLAGSTLAATPVIVLLLVFQRYIIAGIRISGIK